MELERFYTHRLVSDRISTLEAMPLSAGTRLASYEVLSPLGVGGMGEVYRARDTKLGRDVAVKVLPAAFAQDADRMARFAREAQVLASLNHPNIAAIYGVEGTALVMELVEGRTLADRIAQGQIPLEETLALAKQIAEALEYAHDRGVIHRDLKPANVKITPEGAVKVLDFGLAKFADEGAARSDPSVSTTMTIRATEAGLVMGTAGYMSPEQARGETVDVRTDIWSFGVVLYEMLTGRRLFAGETFSDTLAAVLRSDPDWSALPLETPPAIRRLLRRCLERDRKRRLRDIGDAQFEIEEAPETVGIVKPRSRAIYLWAAVAILSTVVALTLAAVHFRETQPEIATVRFQIPAPEHASFTDDAMAVSPDGRRVAFTAFNRNGGRSLWIHALDTMSTQVLPDTDDASNPFWSPDSRSIGFFSPGKLKKIEVSGRAVQTLCDAPGIIVANVSGSWNRDGVIIFGTSATGLFRVPQGGGVTTALTTLDQSRGENAHLRPGFLPDSRHFLYLARNFQTPENSGIYVASLDGNDRKRLLISARSGAYAPSSRSADKGHLLFLQQGTLMAQPVDSARFDLVGEAFPVAEQVGYSLTHGYFSVSGNGVLAYRSLPAYRGPRQLTWFDRQGKKVGVVGPPGSYTSLALLSDGKKIAVSQMNVQATNIDIWQLDVARGVPARVTFDPAIEVCPAWLPDGNRVVFASTRDGFASLYQKQASGAGREEELLKDPHSRKCAYDVSSDGRFVLYRTVDPKTREDLWVLPLDGERKPFSFISTQHNETQGQFAPVAGGPPRWVAYASDESGRSEVYVQSFPSRSEKFIVSDGGGTQPRWRRDGKELYYIAADGKLMVVEVNMRAKFEYGVPKALFETGMQSLVLSGARGYMNWAPAPDGNRFLIITEAPGAKFAPITVVLNWQAAMK
jgi:eukaryotic-like serine/threonine-protein kinase